MKKIIKDKLTKEYIRVEIEEGMGISQIAELLETSGIIRNSDTMKIYAKLNKVNNVKFSQGDIKSLLPKLSIIYPLKLSFLSTIDG